MLLTFKRLKDVLTQSLEEAQTYPDEVALWREIAEEIKSELRTAYGDDVIEDSRSHYEWSFHAVWQGPPQGPGGFFLPDIAKIIEKVVWVVTGEKPTLNSKRNDVVIVRNPVLRIEVFLRDSIGRRVDIEMMDT